MRDLWFLSDWFLKCFWNKHLIDLHLFKEQLVVEKMLYGDSPVFEYIEVQKKDFLVNIFGLFPKLRPHCLENFVFILFALSSRRNFSKNCT